MSHTPPLDGRPAHLTLDVRPTENPDWPALTVVVDGVPLFEQIRPDWAGFDPDDMLGVDSPLLPVQSPRRVALSRCSCREAGCGALVATVSLTDDGRHVRWRDFSRVVGEFSAPLASPPPPGIESQRTALPLPTLLFDLDEYVIEVERASRDRSWLTPRRETAELLMQRLAPLGLVLPPDLPLHRVEPAWQQPGMALVFLRLFDDGTLCFAELRLTSSMDDPPSAATDIAEQLLALEPGEWRARWGVT